jgi:hypothetical protein
VALPDPKPGLVIGYAYLWEREARTGREEAVKDRPCVIILAVEDRGGDRVVLVAPITHTPPKTSAEAVAMPQATKARLGLDDLPSWIVTTELNRFSWPGPDLRPISRDKPDSFAFGSTPLGLLKQVIDQISQTRRLRTVPRDVDPAP